MEQTTPPERTLLPEIGSAVAGWKNEGYIAADTPEFRLFVQKKFFAKLLDRLREDETGEYFTPDEIEEIAELALMEQGEELGEFLRGKLAQYEDEVRTIIGELEQDIIYR